MEVNYGRVKICEIEYEIDDETGDSIAIVRYGDDILRLDDAMYMQDDYFDGSIGDTYFSVFLIKILDDDQVAVCFATC